MYIFQKNTRNRQFCITRKNAYYQSYSRAFINKTNKQTKKLKPKQGWETGDVPRGEERDKQKNRTGLKTKYQL